MDLARTSGRRLPSDATDPCYQTLLDLRAPEAPRFTLFLQVRCAGFERGHACAHGVRTSRSSHRVLGLGRVRHPTPRPTVASGTPHRRRTTVDLFPSRRVPRIGDESKGKRQ